MHTRDYSEHTSQVIDDEVEMILRAQEERALEVLSRHRGGLDAVARALLDEETIDGETVGRLVDTAYGRPVHEHGVKSVPPIFVASEHGPTGSADADRVPGPAADGSVPPATDPATGGAPDGAPEPEVAGSAAQGSVHAADGPTADPADPGAGQEPWPPPPPPAHWPQAPSPWPAPGSGNWPHQAPWPPPPPPAAP